MANIGELTARIALEGMQAVTNQLRNFSNTMDNVADKASQFGEKMRNAGEGLNELGENIAPLSAGLLAIGGSAVVASDNINSAMGNMQAKLGLSEGQMDQYGNVLNEVAKTGVGSFEEVSEAIVAVGHNMKGLSSGEMAEVTSDAQGLATIMGSDVGEVTKVASQLMQHFGVSGTKAMDLIAKGYQNGMDYSGDYMDTLNEYSTYFDSMGFSAEDMFNTLASGAEAGAFNLDKVGDAVKEFGIRSKDGSESSSDAFKSLGMDADKMTQTFAKGGDGAKKAYTDVVTALAGVTDEAERNRIGVELFGSQYEDMEKDVIASTGAVKDSMGDVTGTSGEMIEQSKTFAQEMAGYWAEVQVAIKPVGDTIRGAISDVMPSLISGIKSLASSFNSMSPVMQKVVIGFGAFVAVLPVIMVGIGGVLSVVGTFASVFSGVVRGVQMAIGAFNLLVTAFNFIKKAFMVIRLLFVANPFLLIVTAVIALAVVIYSNWDAIKAYTIVAWGAISTFMAGLWEGIKSVISSFVGWLSSIWASITVIWSAVWNACVVVVQAVWNAIKLVLMIGVAIIGTILNPIIAIFSRVFRACLPVVQAVWNGIKAVVSTIVSHVSSVMSMVKSAFSSAWNAVASLLAPVIARVKSLIATIASHVSSIMSRVRSLFSSAWSAISSLIGSAISAIKSKLQTMASTASSVGSKVKSVFTTAWNGIKSVVSSAIEAIKSKISSIWSTASGISGKIKSAFSNLFSGIKVPKFSISGSMNPKDWISGGKMPSIGVQWNAKGGILDSSTFIGAGEAGAEAIVPLSQQRKMKPFAHAVAKFMPDGSAGGSSTNNFNISSLVVREDADVNRIAKELNKLQAKKNRALGKMTFA